MLDHDDLDKLREGRIAKEHVRIAGSGLGARS